MEVASGISCGVPWIRLTGTQARISSPSQYLQMPYRQPCLPSHTQPSEQGSASIFLTAVMAASPTGLGANDVWLI